MKVILSHPFSGAVYWWFESMREGSSEHFETPSHPYYRTLYGNPKSFLDIALASLVIFEDIILPTADAWYPGSNYESPLLLPNIGIATPESEPAIAAWDIYQEKEDVFLHDAVMCSVLARVPKLARRMAIRDSIADMLLSRQHGAPVICSRGRRTLIERLAEIEKDNSDAKTEGVAPENQSNISSGIASYVTTVGLTFHTRDIPSLAEIKYQERIRSYANDFQKVLIGPSGTHNVEILYERIADAWTSADSNKAVSGSFAAASRSFAVASLIPGAGLVLGPLGLAADATAAAIERRSERQRWYELGPEISRYQSLRSLEAGLKRRKLL